MNSKLIRLTSVVLCICLLAGVTLVTADGITEVEMYVDEGKVIKHIGREMYGINYEWGGNENSSMPIKSGTTEINPEYVKAFDGCLPQGRAAGMSANRLFWKGAIGNIGDRTLQKFWYFAPRKQYFGPVEWFKANIAVEPDTKFIYAVNLYDTQENIADLVEFLRGDGTVNYNGGVDWAAKRKSLGIENPVNILAFELANEIDAGSEGAWKIDRYLDACRRTIKTIRSVDPTAKIAVMKKTSGEDTWMNWHRTLLSELGDQIDYIAAHHYYRSFDDIVGFVRSAESIEADIKSITGSDRIKIFYTEQAGKSTSDVYGSVGYRNPHTMQGILESAEWYVRAASMPVVETSSYHCLVSAGWAVIYSYEGEIKRTGIGDLIRMCATYFSGDSLEVKQSGYSYNKEGHGAQILSAAVKTDDGLNLILVNQTDSECTYNIRFSDGSYKPVRKAELTGPSLESDNYQQYNEISYTDEEVTDGQSISSFTAGPLSITMLKLVPSEADETESFNQRVKSVIAVAPEYVNAVAGGNAVVLDKPPILYRDKLYISLSSAGELFDAKTYLDSTATEAYFDTADYSCTFIKTSDSYYIDGTAVEADEAMIELDGTAYLQARTVAEICGYTLLWDERGFAGFQDGVYRQLSAESDADVLNEIYNRLFGQEEQK